MLLFPELAAVTYDVLARPRGKWASQPVRMMVTPTLTAAAGLLVTRHTSYSALAVLVLVLASLSLIKLLRTTMSPAISAGVLPLALALQHWVYPPAIGVGFVGLAVIQAIWRRYGPASDSRTDGATASSAVEPTEGNPAHRFWYFTLVVFVVALGAVAQITGLHFVLFPPLIVMAYEIFAHAELPDWIARPAMVPIVYVITASVGLLASGLPEAGQAAGVVVTLVVSILLLRASKIHIPPALAISLLPFVIHRPDIWFVAPVGTGIIALTLCFMARIRLGHQSTM